MTSATSDPSLERTYRGHRDAVTALTFHPVRPGMLASGSLDGSVICYQQPPTSAGSSSAAQPRSFKFIGHRGAVHAVHFHPSGQLLASGSADCSVKLWTPSVKGDVTTFKAHSATVRSVQFSGDGRQLLTASDDKSVKIWSTHRAKFLATLGGHLNWVRAARFSPDDRLVLSGSDDKTVKLWDCASKTVLKTYAEHQGIITDVAFHPSGHLVAACSADRSINIWDIRTHKLLQHYGDAHGTGQGWRGTVNSIAFGGKAGEWLISTGGDGLVKLWDLQEGHLFYTLYGHKVAPTTCAVFSEDEMGGEFFASGGADAQVMLWRANFNMTDEAIDFHRKDANNRMSMSVKRHGADSTDHVVEIGQTFSMPTAVHVEKTSHESERVQTQLAVTEEPTETTVRTAPVQSSVPEMAQALTQLVQQLDILTQTMSIIEDRLSSVEDRLLQSSNQ